MRGCNVHTHRHPSSRPGHAPAKRQPPSGARRLRAGPRCSTCGERPGTTAPERAQAAAVLRRRTELMGRIECTALYMPGAVGIRLLIRS